MRLMNFWVENHKNFKTKQGIFFTHEDGTPFTTVGVYGPNSGGKTNFLEACYSIVSGLQGQEGSYTPNRMRQIRNPRMLGLLNIKIGYMFTATP